MPEIFNIPKNVREGQTLGGVALVKNVNIRKTRNGKPFASGSIVTKDGTTSFKKWDTDTLPSGIYEISGVYNVYQGVGSVIINNLVAAGDQFTVEDFVTMRYNGTELFTKGLYPLVKANVSTRGLKLFRLILQGRGGTDKTMANRFTNEQAAIHHHDAVMHGLIAHSYKVTRLLVEMLSDPMRVFKDLPEEVKDVIIVGGALHDLGKTLEYNNGEISDLGKLLSHRTLLSERIAMFKDDIIKLYGDDGEITYYRLQSIVTQHHGEYEETPRTFEAYLVHLADNYDAMLTDTDEALTQYLAGGNVRVGGFTLNL